MQGSPVANDHTPTASDHRSTSTADQHAIDYEVTLRKIHAKIDEITKRIGQSAYTDSLHIAAKAMDPPDFRAFAKSLPAHLCSNDPELRAARVSTVRELTATEQDAAVAERKKTKISMRC